MRKEVILQFPSLRALYLYCAATQLESFELNCRTCRLTCECIAEMVDLALVRFGARVIPPIGARLPVVR